MVTDTWIIIIGGMYYFSKIRKTQGYGKKGRLNKFRKGTIRSG